MILVLDGVAGRCAMSLRADGRFVVCIRGIPFWWGYTASC